MFQHFKNIFWFVTLGLFTMSFAKHEEYYSLTNIQYKENEKSLQITMRLFVDDLENTLKKNYKKDFELNTEREAKDSNSLIERYIKTKFELIVEGKTQNYIFVGKEYEKDMIYIYMEIKNVAPFKTIKIRNATLIDVFPTQENIVKVKAFGTYRSLILNSNSESGNIIF